jgi:Tol biopolymer transport system component
MRVAANIQSAGDPVCAPDGRSVMVFGRESISGGNTDPDWWWVPLETGVAVRTGAYERFKAQGMTVDITDVFPYPHTWTTDGVMFTARTESRDARSLWMLPVDQRTGLPTSDVVRVTNGTTTDAAVAISRNGRMVFSAQAILDRLLFALPVDANGARATGPLRRVREDTAAIGRSSVSVDGRLLVFPKYEIGAAGVWLRDMRTGQERQLVATPPVPLNPVVSSDGGGRPTP